MKRYRAMTAMMLLAMTTAFAQSSQFYLEDKLGEGLQTRIYLSANPEAKSQVQEALYAAVDHARDSLNKMQTELDGINQKKVKDNFMISEELAKAIQAGLNLCEKTEGRFDITTGGSYKKIKVDTKNNSLKITADGMQINLQPMLKGFLADLIADDLAKAGWGNALVKIAGVTVTRGNNDHTPWTIPVLVPSEKVAKRVFYYKTKQEQAAGATSPPASGMSDLKSVTIFSKTGADSEGLAATVLNMGMEEGKKFMAQNKNLGAVFIDSQDNLTHVP